jgi:hypothetical protein
MQRNIPMTVAALDWKNKTAKRRTPLRVQRYAGI